MTLARTFLPGVYIYLAPRVCVGLGGGTCLLSSAPANTYLMLQQQFCTCATVLQPVRESVAIS